MNLALISYASLLSYENVVELSVTAVPPGLSAEVQERRSGSRGVAGTVFRRVPAEINPWLPVTG